MGAVRLSLVEVVAVDRHGVRHVRDADEVVTTRLGERVQPRRLHLDAMHPRRSRRSDGGPGLTERGIGGPGTPVADRLAEPVERTPEPLAQRVGESRPRGRRQVPEAGALAPPRLVDDDEVRRVVERCDGAGRGHRDDQVAARPDQLLRDEHGVRSTDRTRHDADLAVAQLRHPEFAVIAGPVLVTSCVAGRTEVAHHVAVGVEQAHLRHRSVTQVSLTTRLAHHVGRDEDGRFVMVGVTQDQRGGKVGVHRGSLCHGGCTRKRRPVTSMAADDHCDGDCFADGQALSPAWRRPALSGWGDTNNIEEQQ